MVIAFAMMVDRLRVSPLYLPTKSTLFVWLVISSNSGLNWLGLSSNSGLNVLGAQVEYPT